MQFGFGAFFSLSSHAFGTTKGHLSSILSFETQHTFKCHSCGFLRTLHNKNMIVRNFLCEVTFIL